MQRHYLEMALMASVREHLSTAMGLTGPGADVAALIVGLRESGLEKALGNLAESFALGQENQIGVRALIAAYQVPADKEKPIVIKLEADNNSLTGVQLAMLKGEAVDLTGCQGELFAAKDLGIHLSPVYDLFEGAA